MVRTVFARVLRWTGYTVATLALMYLVGANLILNTGILDPLINKKPEKTLIEWQSGWTILPGFIHVEGLRVRGQSKGQQWQFRLGEADVHLALTALIGKTVRASRLRGRNFHFRQRARLKEETRDSSEAASFPEIEGLSNPPDPAPEDIYPPKKKKKRGWHIDIADAHLTGAVELHVGQLKVTGEGAVGGDFDYQIPQDMHLENATFDLADGEIAINGIIFVEDLGIDLDASLGPFRPKETKGLEVFNHFLGTFSLESGTIPDVKVVNALLPPASELELEGGTASFNWHFDKESVEKGSNGHIEIAATGADMLMAGRAISGDFGIDCQLQRGSLAQGQWAVGETTLSLDNVDISVLTKKELQSEERSEPTAEDLWWARFTIRSGTLDLGEPSELAVAFDFALKNTEPLLHLFFAKEKKDGSVKIPVWVRLLPDIEDMTGSGHVTVDGDYALMDDIRIDGNDFDLTAWFESQGEVSNGKLYLRYKGLDFGIDIEDGKSDLKILTPRKWAREQEELDPSAIDPT